MIAEISAAKNGANSHLPPLGGYYIRTFATGSGGCDYYNLGLLQARRVDDSEGAFLAPSFLPLLGFE